VSLLTPDTALGEVNVRLIALSDGAVQETDELIADPDGRFEFEAEANIARTYIVVVDYQGVEYFSGALLISPDIPTATANFEVYATSDSAPDLTIDQTVVTLLAIDRAEHQLTLIREDLVRHGELYIYTGAADAITLRLPAPDGAVSGGGLDGATSDYDFDGSTITVATPLRPGVTSIVTQVTVRYEPDEDEYRLRITAPLATEHIKVRVPESFLREVRPRGDEAAFGPDDEFEGETLTVVERTVPAVSGQSLVADLVGLSGVEEATHPLTSGVGAGVGALLALLVVGGVAIGLRRRIQPAPVSDAE